MADQKSEGGAERRESVRIPVEMWARTYDQARFVACKGDISMGGARVEFRTKPKEKDIEIIVKLGGGMEDLRIQGEIIDVFPTPEGHAFVARVKFTEQLFLDELALARFMDDVSGEWELWSPEGST